MSLIPPMFEKLKFARTPSDQVAQALLVRIESGHLTPGKTHDGLLGSRQGSGVFVSRMAGTRVTRMDEARRLLFMCQVRDEHSVIIEAIHRHDAVAAHNAAAAHMFNAARRLPTAEFRSF